MREQIDYKLVVNISEDDEITVLDYVFNHGTFKGATGSIFYPVSKDSYEERKSLDYIIDSYKWLWQEAVKDDRTEKGLEDWIESQDFDDEFLFDTSYSSLWDYLRTFGYSEEKYPIFECVGGGRCFDDSFQGNINEELSEVIRQYESKEGLNG